MMRRKERLQVAHNLDTTAARTSAQFLNLLLASVLVGNDWGPGSLFIPP